MQNFIIDFNDVERLTKRIKKSADHHSGRKSISYTIKNVQKCFYRYDKLRKFFRIVKRKLLRTLSDKVSSSEFFRNCTLNFNDSF